MWSRVTVREEEEEEEGDVEGDAAVAEPAVDITITAVG